MPNKFSKYVEFKTNPFGGVLINPSSLPSDAVDFVNQLGDSLDKWKKEERYPNYCTEIQQISLPSWMTGAAKGKPPAGYDSIPDITLF